MNIDLYQDPLGHNTKGDAIYLKDIWPTRAEIQKVVRESVKANMYTKRYAEVFTGDTQWQNLNIPKGNQFKWDDASTYVKLPPFFDNIKAQPEKIKNIENARVLVSLLDSVTTDHISPAGNIAKNSPAGLYLQSNGVEPKDFNSYGSRRGNHEVMMRGTFANIRLKNQLVPNTEGNWTLYLPTNETLSIFDAAMRYQEATIPLIILAGKEYGTGSSRDWAAKGTCLLGVKAVIAESFERIHRSNLIGMGIVPLEFLDNQNAQSLNLTGREFFSLDLQQLNPGSLVTVTVVSEDNKEKRQFQSHLRIDTPKEMEYYQHGGILHYVLRELAKKAG
jgi:aconitate hydratase